MATSLRAAGGAALGEVVVDLAAAEQDLLHRRGVDVRLRVVEDHPLEGARGELLEARRRVRLAQQRLRREDDQRLAPRADHLAAQRVEQVRRRGQVHHLHVVLGGHLQEPLDAGARVLRALSFVAVRQEQGEARQAQPLVLRRGEELVDDHLAAVGEVAELRFPDDEPLGRVEAVAVLEPEHAGLAQRAIPDLEAGAGGAGHLAQRHVPPTGLCVVHRGVTVTERSAPRVLSAQADRVLVLEEGRVGELLGRLQ